MTIIKSSPKKYNWLIFLGILLLLGELYIYQYNQLVSLHYQIKNLENELASLKSINLGLQKELYQVTSPSNLEKIAKQQGLILESSPKYLSASNL